jgi:hypothetical protein
VSGEPERGPFTLVAATAIVIGAVLVAVGCGSTNASTPPIQATHRASVPSYLVTAGRWLNNNSDGNVLWSARAEAPAPRLCGAGLSVNNPAVLVVRSVSRRGGWAQVSVNTSTSEASTTEGFSYADDFNGRTPEEILAGTWKCSFYVPFDHSAYDYIKFDGTRNADPAQRTDPVARAASEVAHEEITSCRETASGIDGAIYDCTEAWTGASVTVDVDSSGNLTRVSLPNGTTYRP